MRAAATPFIAVAAAVLFIVPVVRAEDFYEQQLRVAKADLTSGRQVQAADELRIAAFGFLDRPPLLVEALARLALVHQALGHAPDVTQILNRFLDVERHFGVYQSAALEPETRRAFEQLLMDKVPASEITSFPTLSRVIRTEAQKVFDLPPSQRAAAFENGFRRSPRDIDWPLAAAEDAALRGADPDVVKWTRRALSIDSSNLRAQTLLVHAFARSGDCRSVLSQLASISSDAIDANASLAGDRLVCLVAQSRWSDAQAASLRLPEVARARSDVSRALAALASHQPPQTQTRPAAMSTQPSQPVVVPTTRSHAAPPPATTTATQPPATSSATLASSKKLVAAGRYLDAQKLLEPAVAAEPSNRDLRLALLDAAALSRKWRLAAEQIPRLSRFTAGVEAWMVYAATALWELGRAAEARVLMQRARAKLPNTPFVQYYDKLILGSSR